VLKALERVQANISDSESESLIGNLQQEVAGALTGGTGAKAADGQSIFEEGETIDLTSAEDRKKLKLIKNFNTVVEKHPEETVSVIRNWLYQE
jgi:flagellar M-ring protein FliF